MTCFHRTHKSITQLKGKIITLPYHSVEIMGQEKKNQRRAQTRQHKQFGVHTTTTLLMTFCCCEWFCRRETTSRQRTSFCLKVKQKFSMRTETSTAHGAAMMHSRFNCAKSVSLPGSCSVWLFSAVPNKLTQLPSFFFLDLKRTIDQSMKEKQREANNYRGREQEDTRFCGTFGPNSEFQQGLICDCVISMLQKVLPANLSLEYMDIPKLSGQQNVPYRWNW